MMYTMRDLNERAEHEDLGHGAEVFVIDNHRIALIPVWSYGGGRDINLVTVRVNGETIATRCKRNVAIRKALQVISA